MKLMILVCLMITVFADDPSVYRERVELHIRKGDEHYRTFQNMLALREYETAYEIAPDSFSTILRMVRIYNDMGRIGLRRDSSSKRYYRQSLVYADSLRRYFPRRAESHFWLALCNGSIIPFVGIKEKIRTAKIVLAEANRAIELDSTFSLAYVILGIFQREGSEITWFERVIANVVFGGSFSGSLKESESLLKKAVVLDPQNSYAYYEMHRTYKSMLDRKEAIESLRNVLRIPPTNERERQQREEALEELAILEKQ
jgi:hypothetical protein